MDNMDKLMEGLEYVLDASGAPGQTKVMAIMLLMQKVLLDEGTKGKFNPKLMLKKLSELMLERFEVVTAVWAAKRGMSLESREDADKILALFQERK